MSAFAELQDVFAASLRQLSADLLCLLPFLPEYQRADLTLLYGFNVLAARVQVVAFEGLWYKSSTDLTLLA